MLDPNDDKSIMISASVNAFFATIFVGAIKKNQSPNGWMDKILDFDLILRNILV
jgi:hypothetical protein